MVYCDCHPGSFMLKERDLCLLICSKGIVDSLLPITTGGATVSLIIINPFTAEVAIMRLLGSAPKSHLCDQRRGSKVSGLSDQMTLFIDLGCLYCKRTQRAFNAFKNTLNWLKIDSVDQKFNWLECGNFSQDAGMPGTERVIAFSQLAVKGLKLLIELLSTTAFVQKQCNDRRLHWTNDDNVACRFCSRGKRCNSVIGLVSRELHARTSVSTSRSQLPSVNL
jgi:hypothetical protein